MKLKQSEYRSVAKILANAKEISHTKKISGFDTTLYIQNELEQLFMKHNNYFDEKKFNDDARIFNNNIQQYYG